MKNKKFLVLIQNNLSKNGIDKETIDYVLLKVRQSFRNGVRVGEIQAGKENKKAKKV